MSCTEGLKGDEDDWGYLACVSKGRFSKKSAFLKMERFWLVKLDFTELKLPEVLTA